jgi:hypothetical protein
MVLYRIRGWTDIIRGSTTSGMAAVGSCDAARVGMVCVGQRAAVAVMTAGVVKVEVDSSDRACLVRYIWLAAELTCVSARGTWMT